MKSRSFKKTGCYRTDAFSAASASRCAFSVVLLIMDTVISAVSFFLNLIHVYISDVITVIGNITDSVIINCLRKKIKSNTLSLDTAI